MTIPAAGLKIKVIGYHKCLIPEIKKIIEDLVALYNDATEPLLFKVESARAGTYYTRFETYTREEIYNVIKACLPTGCEIITQD